MLDVGLALGIGSGEIEGPLVGNESGQIIINLDREAAFRLHLGVARAGAAAFLHGLDRG